MPVAPPAAPDLEARVSCPTCNELMERLEFAGSSKVFVDVCRLHGIWLDGGELPPVVESARKNPSLQPIPLDVYRSIVSTPTPEPGLTTLLVRRLVGVTKKVVRAVRDA